MFFLITTCPSCQSLVTKLTRDAQPGAIIKVTEDEMDCLRNHMVIIPYADDKPLPKPRASDL